MTSRSLATWTGQRAERLDRLLSAHRAISGSGPGRRWLTSEVNHALIVRLASEFQGFCRDLHDEGVDALTQSTWAMDLAMASVVRKLMESGRRIDSGNANWGNLCSDFGRFGIDLAAGLKTRYPVAYPAWATQLENLNKARNAVAHDDRQKLAECESVNRLNLDTFRRWRTVTTRMAPGLDVEVSAYLQEMTKRAPW